MYLATHDKPELPRDFSEKFRLLKEIGFDAFEIDGKVLLDHHKQIAEASQKTDFPVKMACGGYGGWIGDFSEERRQQGLSDISEILRVCGGVGIDGIVVPAAWGMFSLRLPPMTPPRSADEDTKILLDSLSVLERVAEETGTAVFLEPLNRYENHMVVTLDDAARLIAAGQFSRVKITADFFHMNIEEPKIEVSLALHAEQIGHVHIASSHRYQPGTGHIDYVPGFAALKEHGYDGGFSMESRIIGDDCAKALKESAAFVRGQLRKAGY